MRHSIIIPTCDHPGLLKRCLAALQECRPPAWDWEVLVMDNSTPSFRAENESVTSAHDRSIFRYLPMSLQGLMFARHQGVERSGGDIITFIDDDSFVSASWLTGIEAAFADPHTVLLTGPNRPEFEQTPPPWLGGMWQDLDGGRVLGFLSLIDFGDFPRVLPSKYVWGCNFSIRRQVFDQARGSHPDYLPGELGVYQGDGESALAVKVEALGYRGLYAPGCAIRHFMPASRLSPESFGARSFFLGIQRSFITFRRENGMGPRQGVPVEPPVTWQARLLNKAGQLKHRMFDRSAREAARSADVVKLRKFLYQRFQDGWDLHQTALRTDPALREYVLRSDFMGENAAPPFGGAGALPTK